MSGSLFDIYNRILPKTAYMLLLSVRTNALNLTGIHN